MQRKARCNCHAILIACLMRTIWHILFLESTALRGVQATLSIAVVVISYHAQRKEIDRTLSRIANPLQVFR